MALIQETFLETDWDDEVAARNARNARATQLQEQGLVCTCEDLYNVMGYRVFLVVATEAEPIAPTITKRDDRPTLRPQRVGRSIPAYEER
jgi:hypothetical protein